MWLFKRVKRTNERYHSKKKVLQKLGTNKIGGDSL
jgi:hypothetical protein